MTGMPLVSIITPSFNQAAYLERTMRSVLNQNYPNLEYFVIDGASTDGSVQIIQKYAPRLKGWLSEPDRGQADAINKGFAQASGEIVAWLNSDDFYLPGAIQSAVQALQAHPEWGLVYGDMLAVDSKNELINIQHFGDWTLEDLMGFRIIGQPAVFMRRSALQRAGKLDTDYHFLLDHHLWLRIATHSQIGHIPKLLAAARFHEDAKNVARAADFGRDALQIYHWLENEAELAQEFHRNERKIRAGVHWINGRYLSEGGRPFSAVKEIFRSLFIYPQTALKDWRRILFTMMQLIGLGSFKEAYTRRRAEKLASSLPKDLSDYLQHAS